jgi:hypothetical protein
MKETKSEITIQCIRAFADGDEYPFMRGMILMGSSGKPWRESSNALTPSRMHLPDARGYETLW